MPSVGLEASPVGPPPSLCYLLPLLHHLSGMWVPSSTAALTFLPISVWFFFFFSLLYLLSCKKAVLVFRSERVVPNAIVVSVCLWEEVSSESSCSGLLILISGIRSLFYVLSIDLDPYLLILMVCLQILTLFSVILKRICPVFDC